MTVDEEDSGPVKVSRFITAAHRLFTVKPVPKLDVAGSNPVGRSKVEGLAGHRRALTVSAVFMTAPDRKE